MKKLLKSLFFPGVPYPAALIWHFILGGFVTCLVVLAVRDAKAASSYSTGLIGGALGVIDGFLVWRANRPVQE